MAALGLEVQFRPYAVLGCSSHHSGASLLVLVLLSIMLLQVRIA